MTRYSIIIPHNNRPELVKKLIQSIPDRGDIEILLIDDASEYSVQNKLKEIEHDRKNVTLVFNPGKTSKGAGWARNQGLKQANGEFVLFADSDDVFTEDAFEILDSLLINQKIVADLFLFDVASVDEHGNPSSRNEFRTFLVKKTRNEQEKESCSDDLVRKTLTRIDPPWGKVFKRMFLEKHQIEFDETSYSNDVLFSAKTTLLAGEIFVSRKIIYTCLDHSFSLIKDETDESNRERFEVSVRFNQFIEQFPGMRDFKSITGGFIWSARKEGIQIMLEMWRISRREKVPIIYPIHRYIFYVFRALFGVNKQKNRWYLISGERT